MKGPDRLKPFFSKSPQKLSLPLLIFLIFLLLVIIFAWPDPASGHDPFQAVIPSPTGTVRPGAPTPIPAEYLETADQTTGIIFGSSILVLIIVGGTVGVLRRKNGDVRH
jgi:hypothetical protein